MRSGLKARTATQPQIRHQKLGRPIPLQAGQGSSARVRSNWKGRPPAGYSVRRCGGRQRRTRRRGRASRPPGYPLRCRPRDRVYLVFFELWHGCCEVVFEVRGYRGARDGQRDGRSCEQPGERDLIGVCAVPGGGCHEDLPACRVVPGAKGAVGDESDLMPLALDEHVVRLPLVRFRRYSPRTVRPSSALPTNPAFGDAQPAHVNMTGANPAEFFGPDDVAPLQYVEMLHHSL